MRISAFATLLAATLASMTSESLSLPTFTSTIVSSTCTGLSSKPYYGNFTSLEKDSYVYATEYATNQETLTMLQTVCSDDECYVTTFLSTLTTLITTVDGVLTTYVTASPIPTINDDESISPGVTPTVSKTKASDTPSTVSSQNFAIKSTLLKAIVETSASSTALETNAELGAQLSSDATTKVSKVSSMHSFDSSTSNEAVASDLDSIQKTTILTTTKCSYKDCKEELVTTGVTVMTKSVNGVKTVFTTYCPITDRTDSISSVQTITSALSTDFSTSMVDNDHTTIVTKTYCSNEQCYDSSMTIGMSYITTIISGEETIFSTYCSLSEIQTVSSHPIPESESFVSISSSTNDVGHHTKSMPADKTVNVITNNILTQAKATLAKSSPGSSSKSNSISMTLLSTYEGGAAQIIPAAFALPLIFIVL